MMTLDLLRLLLGVSIAVFHRPIAVTIMHQESALDDYFRHRGIHLPAPLSDAAAQDLYSASASLSRSSKPPGSG